VKIHGSNKIGAPPERAFHLLQDPGVLARCMPGCEGLDFIGENEYAMRMKMKLASVSGLFDGKVRIADSEPPVHFRLIVEGAGKIGFMKGDGVLRLSPIEAGTEVAFDGEVHVGGTIAAVGQRLLDMTAKMLIKRFFDCLGKEVEKGITSAAGEPVT
jgi:carbon monoxide dehydrogenase subunit G